MRRGLGKGSDLEEDVASLVATLRAENELSGHNENWLVSYADMMTLLFGFFAMLYLMNGKIEPMSPRPPPPPPAAQASAEHPQTEAAKGEGSASAPRVHSRKDGSAGGNLGAFFVEFLPPELATALALASLLHYFFYRLGERRRRLELLPHHEEHLGRGPPPLRVRPALQTSGAVLEDAELFEVTAADSEEIEDVGDAGESHGVVLTDERWLISYADLMTLLFGFFAMLYLMGPNFEAVKKAMEDTFTNNVQPAKAPSLTEKLAMPADLSPEALRDLMSPPPTQLPPPAVAPAPVPPLPVTAAPPAPAAPVAVAPPVATAPKTETRRTPTLQEMEEAQMQALKERLSKTRVARHGGTAGTEGQGGGEGGGGGQSHGQGGEGGAGQGGGGLGGGGGKSVGKGSHAGGGTTICDSSSSIPYRPTCSGFGFFGCLDPDNLFGTGGLNGDGGALEFFCVNGRTRVCQTWERCPWRGVAEDPTDYPEGLQNTSASPADMICSPYGLGGNLMATCRGAEPTCGFNKMFCDPDGRLSTQ